MHEVTLPDDYGWPTCVACNRDLWENETSRWACRPCEDKTRIRLGELPTLFARLNTTAALMRGARKVGANTSGSRVPPIPPRLEVLNLAAVGGVATRLQAIEDAWRQALGRRIEPVTNGVRVFAAWRANPARAVPGQVAFLTINLERACEGYDSVGQDINDLRQLQAECDNALNPDRRPGRVKIGLCPVVLDDDAGIRCQAQLTASTGSFLVRCGNCATGWDGKDEWKRLSQAQRQAQQTSTALIGVAA